MFIPPPPPSLGDTYTPEQRALFGVFALIGGVALGVGGGYLLGGKEFAIAGGIVAPVVVISFLAKKVTGT